MLVGALLAQLWVRRKVPTRGLSLAAWPTLVVYGFLATNGASKRFLYNGGFTLVALAVAVMILALLESNWSFARVLCLPPLRTVGRVSYGLYIWHLAVFQAVVHYGTNWSSTTRLVTGLGVTAAACWLSWTFVEQPFLRWKARLEPGRRRVRPGRETRIRQTAWTHPSHNYSTRARGDLDAAVGERTSTPATRAVGPGRRDRDPRRGGHRRGDRAWVGRNNTAVKKVPPTTFPVTRTLVKLPNTAGQNVYVAAGALGQLHLNVKVGSATSKTAGRGTVVAQAPPAGTTVHTGSIVLLTISRGP